MENRSGTPIRDIYARKSGAADWGPSATDGESIAAGAVRHVALEENSGCHYDVRIVFQDGRSEEKANVDLCQQEVFVIDGANDQPAEKAQKR